MLKHFAVVAVTAVLATSLAFGATDVKSAQKEFKGETKVALADVKASIATELAAFNTGLATLLAGIKGGTIDNTAHTQLATLMSTAIRNVFADLLTANDDVDTKGAALMDASDGTASNNLGDNNILGFSEGDGGTLDKHNAAVKKLLDKFMATLAKSGAKVAKALEKGTSGGFLMAVRVNTLHLPGGPSPNATQNGAVILPRIPLQVTHLVTIANTSTPGQGGLAAGGLADVNSAFDLYDADNLSTPIAEGAAAISSNQFSVTGSTLPSDNLELDVGPNDGSDDITGNGVTESIGVR